MTFLEAVESGVSQFGRARGRASRSEFWFIVLFCILVDVAVLALALVARLPMLIFLCWLVIPVWLPALVRRLHDTGRSAWWLLLLVLSIIGDIVLLVFAVEGTHPMLNRYGPPPR